MSISRKDFVLNVVEDIQKNPRAVLAGHGIQAAVLQTIVSRPDVMSKLATVLYSTVYAKKGAPGLKKAANFKISGYKNFPDFNLKAREDVETFIDGLSAEDAAKFTNEDNILTILMLPDSVSEGDETTAQEIVSGKSVALTFDNAVKKEYKISGGMYLTVMLGDSAARPAEASIAVRKEKANKVKESKRTPARIQSELKSKANKKLAILKRKRENLDATAFNTAKELEQFNSIGKEFGVTSKNPMTIKAGINAFDASVTSVKAIVDTLDAENREYYDQAVKYMKNGNEKMAKKFLKEINNPEITGYVLNGAVSGSDEVIANRKASLKAKLKSLVGKNEQLIAQLSNETNESRKNSIRSMVSKNNAGIKDIRAKLGTYKNISVKGMMNKSTMLKETHAAIEANIAAGNTISQALNKALDALTAKPEQKQLIKQQIMQQVAQNVPMQYAVQQAIQQNFQEPAIQDFTSSSLSGNIDIENLLAKL